MMTIMLIVGLIPFGAFAEDAAPAETSTVSLEMEASSSDAVEDSQISGEGEAEELITETEAPAPVDDDSQDPDAGEDSQTGGEEEAEEVAADTAPPVQEDEVPAYSDDVSQDSSYDTSQDFSDDASQDIVDGDEAINTNEETSAEQVEMATEMETYSLTNNIVGEVITEAINHAQKNGGASEDNDKDKYPMDPHERTYYGDSSRVRDLDNGNYLVYRDSFLLISQADRANYTVAYSGDRRTAYISPAFSEADLEGKTGIVFLADKLGNDEILVFGGTPYYEDGKLVVPLEATEDITLKQLFSDGKLHFSSLEHDTPIVHWETEMSGTNWSGDITDHDVQDISFDVDFDIMSGGFEFVINLDLSFDFEITTTGASGGRESALVASISIPVEDLFAADVIFNAQAEFDETPIQVIGTLLTDFDYTFSILTGAEIKNFRTPVTIRDFTVINPEDYNKDINFYLGSEMICRGSFIEIELDFYFFVIDIGPILSLNQDCTGGCYFTARYEKDLYDKPDPSMDEIHICARDGEEGCLSLNSVEKAKVSIYIKIDFSPIAGPWEFNLYTDETVVETKQFYDSYTFQSGMQPGICPHRGFRIDVTVDTTKGTSTEGAAVSYTPVSESFEPFASAVADQDGKAVLFAPANEQIQVKAELESPHDPDRKISGTEPLDKTAEVQDLQITLEIPEKHVYFKNPSSGTATNWPNDITFAPFLSEHVVLSAKIPGLSGYQFIEWNTSQDGSGTSYAPGTALELDDDLTLWAQWEKVEKSWFVVYNAHGGKNAPKTQIVPQGQDDVLSSQKPEAGTMIFRGWALDESAPEPGYQPGDTLPYDSSKNVVVLYALWTLDPAPRPITIVFDANGGKLDTVPGKLTGPKNSSFQIPHEKPSWDSEHDFRGWSVDPKAKEPQWVPGVVTTFEQDMTLYAVWKVKTHTITYRLNGGTYKGSKNDITETYEFGTEITIHKAPEREGYTFLYWKGSQYQPGNKYTVSEDHSFTAQWEKKSDPTPTPEPTPDPDNPSGGSGNGTSVKTGDNSNITLWLVLMIASLLALATVIRLRCRKTGQEGSR